MLILVGGRKKVVAACLIRLLNLAIRVNTLVNLEI